jgi:asparagine synthetase B (glutamine-hydrolysing)
MCGFLIADRTETSVNNIQAIDQMSYRGQLAYKGYKHWKGYDMCHIALPMIDPDPEIAIQPIQHRDEPPSMFVGEIFNYKDFADGTFKSDAHMIHHLNCWGELENFIHQFDGFWSFVTFMKDEPLVYTDFLSIKPVYYRTDMTALASEPDVLKQYGPVTSNQLFHSNVLKWGYDPTGGTPWNEIKQLKPGHYYYQGEEFPYWDWNQVNYTNLYDDLAKAVKLRLGGFREAAILLSGGLDSTIIYQLAMEQDLDITAIHVNNHEKNYVEMLNAKLTFAQLDKISTTYAIEVHQSPVDLGSVKPQIAMAQALRKLGFYNVLSGDGADELFGGYSRAKEYDSQYSDVFCELPFYHLPKLDRTMMRSTVELRPPFLAPSVIQHGLHTPYYSRNGEKKRLKSVFGDIIPQPILSRAKHPLKTDEIRDDPMRQRLVNQSIWKGAIDG